MDKLKSFTNRWSTKENANESTDPGLRRKEQVRRAQQTYRLRKESYIKSLEREILHLRTAQSNLTGETRRLRAEVRRLRQVIEQHGIVLPVTPPSLDSGITSPRQENSPQGAMATLCIDRNHLNNKRLAVFDDDLTHGTSPGSVQTATEGFRLPDGSFTGQSDVVAAMNFILSLEAPCLDHVRAALGTPSAQSEMGHGHALTLTASVFRIYSDTSLLPDEDELLHVSKQTLSRLLELSVQVITAEELTPTQVWAFLHQIPAFADPKTRQGKIINVAQELARYMKCHGYGAVISREVVTRVVSQVISLQGS
ncbi:bZIP transcription factor [Aspergillus foveolatus]|uniref:bZIP transcription factor n=1 Tax=Aspergillus foveolatus TaxID=210207 RepID=UPI003CCDF6BF